MMKRLILCSLILFPIILAGQYGPGGVGGNEDEKSEDQPLNVLWLRADALNLSDNDPVDTWPDVSGYGFDAVKGRSGNPGPLFRENMLNGFPWVHFSLNNFMKITDEDELDGGTGLSIFIVADYDPSTRSMWDKDHNKTLVCKRRHWNAWSHVPEITKDAAGLQHAYEIRFEYDTTKNPDQDSVFVIAYINGNLPDGSGQDVFTDPDKTSDPDKAYLINYNYSGLEGSEGGRIRVNGISTKQPNRGELNPNPILVGDIIESNADLYIGAAQLDPPGNYGYSESFDDPFPEATEQALMEGGIAELIIYREALTPAEVRIVEHYLGVKYGIEFEEPIYYSNTEYKYDVIGIGTADGVQIHSYGKAGAFSLEAVTESFESAEDYVFAGHDNLPIELSNVGFSEDNILGWNRSWWMEKNGDVSAKIFFDFIEAGLRLESVSDYRLAYRASKDDPYQLLDLPAKKQLRSLYFEIPEEQMQNGIYTLAYLEESTNVSSIDISDNIDIYPNPANTKYSLNFESEIKGELNIRILDISGRELNRYSEIKSEFYYKKEFSATGLEPGLYYIEIEMNQHRAIKLFIKR